jgi:hypothetical protein
MMLFGVNCVPGQTGQGTRYSIDAWERAEVQSKDPQVDLSPGREKNTYLDLSLT